MARFMLRFAYVVFKPGVTGAVLASIACAAAVAAAGPAVVLDNAQSDDRIAQDPQHATILEAMDATVSRLGASDFRVSRQGDPMAGIHPHMLYSISAMDARSSFLFFKAYMSDSDATAAWQALRPSPDSNTDPFHGHPAFVDMVSLDQFDWATVIGRFVIQSICNGCMGPAVYQAEALYAEADPRGLFAGGPVVVQASAAGYAVQTRYVDNSDNRATINISGRVTLAATGAPLEGVPITIAGGAAPANTVTGSNGTYALTATVSGGTGEKAAGGVDFLLQPDVAQVLVSAEPSKIGVKDLGTYTSSVVVHFLDSSGKGIPGLTPTLTTSGGGSVITTKLVAEADISDENGLAFYRLELNVQDASALPLVISVLARESVSGTRGSAQLTVEAATFEVEIVDPVDGTLSEADQVTVRGVVRGADPAVVSLQANVLSAGEVTVPPQVVLDSSGGFAFRVALTSPDKPYTIEVVATNDLGYSHSDTVTVRYMGWSVDVAAIDVPEIVSEGEQYDVIVTLRYSAPEAGRIDVEVWPSQGDQGQSRSATVGPGAGEIIETFSFSAPGGSPVLDAAAPDQAPPAGTSTINVEVVAGFQRLGLSVSVSETILLDQGIKGAVQIDVKVPAPGQGELGIYGNLTHREWSSLKRARRTTSKLIFDKGLDAKIVLANTGTPGQDPALTFSCPYPPQVDGRWNLSWHPDHHTIQVEPGKSHILRLRNQFQGQGNNGVSWFKPRTPKYWVSLQCDVSDGSNMATALVRSWFYVGSPNFSMKVQTLYQEKNRNISFPPSRPWLHAEPAVLAGATETLTLNPGSPIAARWMRIGGDRAVVQTGASQIEVLAQSAYSIYLPIVAKPIGPVRIVLDWDDPAVDVDLHVYGPDGRSLGAVYGHDIVMNNVPRSAYGGVDSKAQWVTLHDPEPGDYLLVAYAPGTDRSVVADLTVDGYLGDDKPAPATSTVVATAMATPTSDAATATTTLSAPPSATTQLPPPATTQAPTPTGTWHASTPTSTPTPSPSTTPSPTATTPATVAPSCTNLLVNGDFENGLANWELVGEASVRFGDYGGGRLAAMLSGRNSTTGSLSQSVTIPPDAVSAHLTYRWRVASAEPTTSTFPFDKLGAMTSLSPDTLFIWELVSNLSPQLDNWMPSGYDIGAAPGPLEVRFEGTNSPQNPTEFFIDDVQLTVCTGSAPAFPSISVQPSSGTAGAVFAVTGSGFRPNEALSVWLLDPNRLRLEVIIVDHASPVGEYSVGVQTRSDFAGGSYELVILGHDRLLPAKASFTLTGSD